MADISDTADTGQAGSTSRGTLSLILGIATVAGFVLALVATDSNDEPEWLWFISPVLGLGALVAGFAARENGRFGGRALIGMVIGALAILNMIVWTVAGG
jgi:peptidoglycan/LPS O-acetylase OafA/YrhL